MAKGFSFQDSSILTEAKVSMSMAFERSLKTPYGLWFEQLATTLSSSGKSSKYPIMGGLTALREWQGERHFENFSRYAYEIANKTFEKSVGIDVDDIDDDQLDGYSMLATEIGYQAAQWPQDLIAAVLKAGGTSLCWDSQFFFDTDHPVDPNDATLGVYANLFTSTALTATNLNTVMSNMMLIAARDGRPAGFGKSGKMLLVVPPQLKKTALEITVAETLINSGGTASGTNVMRGMADVLVIPELGVGGGANATTWYLADVGHIVKPFIFQQRMSPQVTAMNGATDPSVFYKNQAHWGVKARGAAGYSMPWLMAKATA
jgi:phage major head subunit gpT-like protein